MYLTILSLSSTSPSNLLLKIWSPIIKKITADNKSNSNRIDVVAGKPGYQRVEDESTKILRLLQEHDGYLPYYDKSDPEEIYAFFGMSKKTFKMVTGNLYKQKKISFEKTGIKIIC